MNIKSLVNGFVRNSGVRFIFLCSFIVVYCLGPVDGTCNTTSCYLTAGNDRYGNPREFCCNYFETSSCCSQAENDLFNLYFQLTLGLSIAIFVIILIIIIIILVICCKIYQCIKCFFCCCCRKD